MVASLPVSTAIIRGSLSSAISSATSSNRRVSRRMRYARRRTLPPSMTAIGNSATGDFQVRTILRAVRRSCWLGRSNEPGCRCQSPT